MKNKNDLDQVAGIAATILGAIGLIQNTFELISYQIQNPDFTMMRVLIENPHLIIWIIIYAGALCSGLGLVEHYKNNWRK